MDTRKRLSSHDSEVGGQYDRNQKLTGILRQNTRSTVTAFNQSFHPSPSFIEFS